MYKRRSDALTGGTGDVNPQWMNIPVQGRVVAAGTGSVTGYVVPRSPLTQNGRAQIIELLKIEYALGAQSGGDTAWGEQLAVCTANPGTAQIVALTDPKCVDLEFRGLSQATPVTQIDFGIIVKDLTDGSGHGVMIATDNLYIQQWCNVAITAGTTTLGPYGCGVKILYRYKNVSVQEYIGIVQSQN